VPPPGQAPAPLITDDQLTGLVGTAGRAPSLHNTQPWRFQARGDAVELGADPERWLRHADPDGREMLISCGAALFGLRLGLRKLGCLPLVELLPDPAERWLLARVRPGDHVPITRHERELLAAVPHRYTHRGPFGPGPVSAGLLAALQRDAAAEGAELVQVEDAKQLKQLSRLAQRADRGPRSDLARAEARQWARPLGSPARDGIPAQARVRAAEPDQRTPSDVPQHERLPQRDFGSPGQLPSGGWPAAATAVLTTRADTAADWLRAGQALHRLLLDAATRWVFASLYTEILETPSTRAELRAVLGLSGQPQIILQLGRANTAAPTPRRPPGDVVDGLPAGRRHRSGE
jgi:hypothetical protein